MLLLDAETHPIFRRGRPRDQRPRNFAMLEAWATTPWQLAMAIFNGIVTPPDSSAPVHFPALAANLLALDSDQPFVAGLRSHALFGWVN